MTMGRLRVQLGGTGVVGPGLMTFYAAGGAPSPGPIKNFLSALVDDFPTDVTFTVPNDGDLLDEATGELTGTWTGSGGGAVTGAGTGNYILGAGGVLKWTTGGLFRGRHVRGRTFLVPLVAADFDADGRILAARVTGIVNAASNYMLNQDPPLGIWSRPTGGTPGKVSNITAVTMSTLPSSLRSRRT